MSHSKFGQQLLGLTLSMKLGPVVQNIYAKKSFRGHNVLRTSLVFFILL